MTHEQHIASSHWSMYGSDGFPVRKMGRKWWIVVDATSLWSAVSSGIPTPFKTKVDALEFWNSLCLQRFREWKERDVQPKGFEQRIKEAQYGRLPLNSANRG